MNSMYLGGNNAANTSRRESAGSTTSLYVLS